MRADDGFFGQFTPTDSGHPASAEPLLRSSGWTWEGAIGLRLHGEVFNAEELCGQLGLPRDTPAARALLAGWLRWAEALLPRIDGVFALAIQDRHRLRLFRDPSGLRNLYLHTGQAGRVSFGTDLQDLMRLPGVAKRLARHSLHEYLRFGDIAAPHTVYQEVLAVRPGHMVCWSTSGIEEHRVSTADSDDASPCSFGDAVEMLDRHLAQGIQRRLQHAERPASFLSGGIDSALLVAIASRQRRDLTAVTVGFDNSADDESPVAQRIAAHVDIRHEILKFSRSDYLGAFERINSGVEQPIADPALASTVLAFEHCKNRFDVVIDGTGADEGLGLMPPRHVRLAVQYASVLPRPLRAGLTGLLRSVPSLAGYAPVTDFEHPADTMIRWQGFTRQEIERLCGEPVSFAHTEFYQTFQRHPRAAHFERYSALINAMPCDRLNQAMRLSGLPVRFPFCESRTDRFVRSLPVEHRYLPGEPKRILRALLARYVPRSIWEAPKHGFNFPLGEFLAADDYALVKRLRDPGPWLRSAQMTHAPVRQYASEFMAGDRRLAFRVWTLVLLGAWLERQDDIH